MFKKINDMSQKTTELILKATSAAENTGLINGVADWWFEAWSGYKTKISQSKPSNQVKNFALKAG